MPGPHSAPPGRVTGPPAFLHAFSEPARTTFRTLVSGNGSTVVDRDGRTYLDAMASLWCVNAGHGRQEIIDAVTAQMARLATYNTFGQWSNEPAEQLAERIRSIAAVPDARVFFTSSGSEAVDTAMKLARLVHVRRGDPERVTVVAREGGYHGTAYGGTSAQGIEPNRAGYGPLVGDVVHVPRHDLEAVSSLFAEHGPTIAAVVTEAVQGAGGVHPPAPGYLEGLRRLCDRHGALLVLDEVITGFGRLGHWFAGHRYGVEADLVTFAKGVTSGYVPLGGVIVGPRVRDALESDPDFVLRTGFTYSGHPTAAAAGLACLDVIQGDGLLERATAIGGRLEAGLRALLADGAVDEVRGEGAVWAVDLPPERSAAAAGERLLDAGEIVRPIGPSTIALCPPLVMTDGEVDRVLDALAAELAR